MDQPRTSADRSTDEPNDPIQRVRQALAALEAVADDRGLLASLSADERRRLLQAAGRVYCPDVQERRRLVKAMVRQRTRDRLQQDDSVLHETGIRKLRKRPVFTTPNVEAPATDETVEALGEEAGAADCRELVQPQACYVCKRRYAEVHPFYDLLCPPCAELNFRKRTETADLRGRVALVTGGRVKIGYQACIKLLRAGAHVLVTTRFPRDSAARYAAEPDFEQWGHRLEIFGLDLRHSPSVEAFCRHLLSTRDRLDYLINNACQTVRRPPAFYEHMLEREAGALHDLPERTSKLLGAYEGLRRTEILTDGSLAGGANGIAAAMAPALAGLTHAAALSQIALLPGETTLDRALFPQGRLDQDLQQVDLRERNSWRFLMDEVPTVELLEVQLVNAIAPFLLNARLKTLMLRTPGREKHIVNVSAVEGQFYRRWKTTRHPHTNMAKAALNMMTRTSAADYHQDGIHMNAVDTGWVTDEDPVAIAAKKQAEHRFHPPLDIVDGAARITDPIIDGVNTGVHVWGKFLKDYKPTDW